MCTHFGQTFWVVLHFQHISTAHPFVNRLDWCIHTKNDARLVVLMMVAVAVLMDTNDVVEEAGDARDVDVTSSRSSKGASESSGRNRDSGFVCW